MCVTRYFHLLCDTQTCMSRLVFHSLPLVPSIPLITAHSLFVLLALTLFCYIVDIDDLFIIYADLLFFSALGVVLHFW